jgi:O-acetyl-ADP-ribose deacetylase (regulator of RNase III)
LAVKAVRISEFRRESLDSTNRTVISVDGTNEERMLTYMYASLFDSPAQTFVNTVNTVGVMGKGIAKIFRERYPKMYAEYRKLCDREQLKIGNLHLWKGDDRWVLNFPTKTTWRLPSKLEYIEKGLETFANNYERMGIVSASFPPLGCGNGNLNWSDVRPVMERFLGKLSIPIYVHNLHVGAEFVPEHREHHKVPAKLDEFWDDLRSAMYENKNVFFTGEGNHQFSVRLLENEIAIMRGGRQREKIPFEEIENAWVILRDGLLSVDKFSDVSSRRYKSYFFPLLKSLPYVRSARISRVGHEGLSKAEALFFAKQPERSKDAHLAAENKQECLSL